MEPWSHSGFVYGQLNIFWGLIKMYLFILIKIFKYQLINFF
jgi:hypothetical protein